MDLKKECTIYLGFFLGGGVNNFKSLVVVVPMINYSAVSLKWDAMVTLSLYKDTGKASPDSKQWFYSSIA